MASGRYCWIPILLHSVVLAVRIMESVTSRTRSRISLSTCCHARLWCWGLCIREGAWADITPCSAPSLGKPCQRSGDGCNACKHPFAPPGQVAGDGRAAYGYFPADAVCNTLFHRMKSGCWIARFTLWYKVVCSASIVRLAQMLHPPLRAQSLRRCALGMRSCSSGAETCRVKGICERLRAEAMILRCTWCTSFS